MFLAVSHETRYQYTAPVWLEPHVLHLRPPAGPFQTIHQFRIEIDPLPVLLTEGLDAEGNPMHLACFSGPADHLTVRSKLVAETRLENPFGYLIYPFGAVRVPFRYPGPTGAVLQPFLQVGAGQQAVKQYAMAMAAEVEYDTLAFLNLIIRRIYQDFEYQYREFGQPGQPAETLARKKGACRDFSLLMMEMCRSLGLAARFVSGYLLGNPHKEQYLHAWVEVYLPGGGWRGYDPTQGEVAADRHVVLAASAVPEIVSPVNGIYRGTAGSSLETIVSVTETTFLTQQQMLTG